MILMVSFHIHRAKVMPDISSLRPPLKAIIEDHLRGGTEAAALRDALRAAFSEFPSGAKIASEELITAIMSCVKAWTAADAKAAAAVIRLVPSLLAAWERLTEAAPSETAGSLPDVLRLFPEQFLNEGKWLSGVTAAECHLGRRISGPTVRALGRVLGPEALNRWIKSDLGSDLITALVTSEGERLSGKTLADIFKRAAKDGMSSHLARAFAGLKYRVVFELLPLDATGEFGDSLPDGVLVAVLAQASQKAVTAVLRTNGSAKVVSACLRERVMSRGADGAARVEHIKAFFEGIQRSSEKKAEIICRAFFETALPTADILQAFAGKRAVTVHGSWQKTGVF